LPCRTTTASVKSVLMPKSDKPPVQVTDENVDEMYDRFLKDKMLVEGAEERLAALKAGLLSYAEANGIVDDGGHQWIALDSGLTFKRQVSKRETLNEDRLLNWLEEVGRVNDAYKTIQVLDQDKVTDIWDDEELTADDIDKFYDTKYIYSFIPGER
jgi:hypothetical protein